MESPRSDDELNETAAFGPRCLALILSLLRNQGGGDGIDRDVVDFPRQGSLFPADYDESSPSIRSAREWRAAVEHLEYAVFRRFQNELTKAERARLDNTISNALYKLERRVESEKSESDRQSLAAELRPIRESIRAGRERLERQKLLARRTEAKLARLDALTGADFEEFVADLFEALGFEVQQSGGTGDEGADLLVRRNGLSGIVQCKYQKNGKGVIGSPELQKFLGAIRHFSVHKGFFVTTRTFSLSAERFASEHPIELIDGPRLVELVHEAVGPVRSRAKTAEPGWF